MTRVYWVWWRRPGLLHEHATEIGGVRCATYTRARELIRQKMRDGYVVECYETAEVSA